MPNTKKERICITLAKLPMRKQLLWKGTLPEVVPLVRLTCAVIHVQV